MQFTFLSCIFLAILTAYYLPSFRIPCKIPIDLLKITGGFPTLIEQFYEDLSNFTAFQPENAQNFVKFIKNEEFSGIFTILCNSKSSYKTYNITECYYKSSQNFSSCQDPILIGNTCQNVVTHVKGTIGELDNVPLNSQIFLEIEEKPEYNETTCNNYTIGDFVKTSNFLLKFENSSEILEICEEEEDFFDLVMNFCNNCEEECDVPLINLTSISCSQGDLDISIYHTKGYIFSATISQQISNLHEISKKTWKKSINFYESTQNEEKSRYELKHGRFHCPSERTCLLELLYPLQLLKSLDVFPTQITLLILAALLYFAMIFKGT
ncbi:unnamed protein product [Caenorhabditis angaria]|uniref:Uncharacterized protein n=1 Tax=Caenorhabditis angaria TaxID=860376 RepID=A0A9P1IG05_9PELO|nr:unnamed protein product [Caenorhabditis angaria]